MLTASRFLLATLALVSVAGVACGRLGGSGSGERRETTQRRDETKLMHYTTTAAGDVGWEVDGRYPVRVLSVESDDPKLEPVTLLSVGPNAAIVLPDGRSLRVAFDLTRFKGDGTYKLRVGSPRDLVEQSKSGVDGNTLDHSNVFVQLWAAGVHPTEPAEVFDTVVDQPCTVVVRRGGDEGRLTCSKVSNQSGKSFNLDMSWEPLS